MRNALHEGKLVRIREKLKKFFKKISHSDKDSINLNPKVNPDKDHLYRDDLKMY
ncbi:MAG: hypothetical protein ACXVLQ_09670 [Bacteriovorax sp.]